MEHMKEIGWASRKVDVKELKKVADLLTVKLMAIPMEHCLVVKTIPSKEKMREIY